MYGVCVPHSFRYRFYLVNLFSHHSNFTISRRRCADAVAFAVIVDDVVVVVNIYLRMALFLAFGIQ